MLNHRADLKYVLQYGGKTHHRHQVGFMSILVSFQLSITLFLGHIGFIQSFGGYTIFLEFHYVPFHLQGL